MHVKQRTQVILSAIFVLAMVGGSFLLSVPGFAEDQAAPAQATGETETPPSPPKVSSTAAPVDLEGLGGLSGLGAPVDITPKDEETRAPQHPSGDGVPADTAGASSGAEAEVSVPAAPVPAAPQPAGNETKAAAKREPQHETAPGGEAPPAAPEPAPATERTPAPTPPPGGEVPSVPVSPPIPASPPAPQAKTVSAEPAPDRGHAAQASEARSAPAAGEPAQGLGSSPPVASPAGPVPPAGSLPAAKGERAAAKAVSPATKRPDIPPASLAGPSGRVDTIALHSANGKSLLRIETSVAPQRKGVIVFKGVNPARLVVDLHGTWTCRFANTLPGDGGRVARIRLGRHPKWFRLVLDLTGDQGRLPEDPVVTVQGRSVLVTIPGQ